MSAKQIRKWISQSCCFIAVLLCIFSCSEKLAPENLTPLKNETLAVKGLFEKR